MAFVDCYPNAKEFGWAFQILQNILLQQVVWAELHFHWVYLPYAHSNEDGKDKVTFIQTLSWVQQTLTNSLDLKSVIFWWNYIHPFDVGYGFMIINLPITCYERLYFENIACKEQRRKYICDEHKWSWEK